MCTWKTVAARIALAWTVVTLLFREVAADPGLLIGNTRADNIVAYYEKDEMLMEYVAELNNPDHIRVVDDYLYVTVGDSPETSTMYRMNMKTGHVDKDFLKGGDLLRPYGFDFYKDRINVASFLTDKVIIYDMYSGAYIGVFAAGDGTEEGLVNGPNHIAIYEDYLYLTTQGSVATNGEPVYGLSSQIAVFDLHTGQGQVFAPQPTPLEDSLGFVSMLGIQIYCPSHGMCYAYTSDFAGGLRVYTLDGELVSEASTTYESGAIAGAISIADGKLYVPGFVDDTTDGVVQRFTVELDGSLTADDDLFVGPSAMLVRPIGVLALGSYGTKASKAAKSSSSKSYGKGMMMMGMMKYKMMKSSKA